MSGLTYLALAYFMVWLFIFGYLFLLGRRQKKLKQQIQYLTQMIAVDQGQQPPD